MTFSRTLLVFSTFFSMTVPAIAAVEIQTPENIVLLAVNDQDIKTGFLGGEKKYQIDAGEHEIQVRYQQFFELSNTEHDIVRSGTIRLKTPALQDGARYTIQLINAPKTHEEAKEFAKQPKVGVFNAQQQLVAESKGAVKSAGLLSQLFGQTQDLTASAEPKASAVPTATSPTVAALTAPSSTVEQQKTVQTGSVDQQLIQLWQKATPAERQKFTAWLGSQAN